MDYEYWTKTINKENRKINNANRRFRYHCYSLECCVVQGDVSAIPFPDAVFDYVSAFETVYFWPGLEKCFFEINRVLKNGGTFLISLIKNLYIILCVIKIQYI